jgi:cell division GTPase FtsZ
MTMAMWEELSNLQFEDIVCTVRGNLSIRYTKAKNNQFGAARMAAISSISESLYDPVNLMAASKILLSALLR